MHACMKQFVHIPVQMILYVYTCAYIDICTCIHIYAIYTHSHALHMLQTYVSVYIYTHSFVLVCIFLTFDKYVPELKKNNFIKFQDALDLAAGHYNVSRGFSFRQERKGVEIFAVSVINNSIKLITVVH